MVVYTVAIRIERGAFGTVTGKECLLWRKVSRSTSFIAALERSVEAGLAYFQGPGSQSQVHIGRYGPREILCQLVWWHQVTVEGMESVASGGTPYRIYASVDEMNARAVGRLAGKDQSTSNFLTIWLVSGRRDWCRQRVP